MTVPQIVSPTGQYAGLYKFEHEGYRLEINYGRQTFMLYLAGIDRFIKRKFSFIDNPPDWFVVLDFGLTDWIRKAIDWKPHTKESKGIQVYQLVVEGLLYEIEHDTSNDELVIAMPARLIIDKRRYIFDNLPELAEMDLGQLRENIVEQIKYMTDGRSPRPRPGDPHFPVEFDPKPLYTNRNEFRFDYNEESDLVYLLVPDRFIYTHVKLLDRMYQEVGLIHKGKLRDAIRERLNLKD